MPRGDYPSSKQDQYMVRFPDGLRDKLKAMAAENKRSMNAEIVARLERTFAIDESNRRMAEARARGDDPWGDIPAPTGPEDYGMPLDAVPDESDIDATTRVKLLEWAVQRLSKDFRTLVQQLEKESTRDV